jgi:hypothetical protein
MSKFELFETHNVSQSSEITGELSTVILLFKKYRHFGMRLNFFDFSIVIPTNINHMMPIWNFSFQVLYKDDLVVEYKVKGTASPYSTTERLYPYKYELFKKIFDEQLEKEFMFYIKLAG